MPFPNLLPALGCVAFTYVVIVPMITPRLTPLDDEVESVREEIVRDREIPLSTLSQ